MELTNVKLSEITFDKKLFASNYAVAFLVTVRDQTCVMKVHHGRGPRKYYEPKNRELDLHVIESTAYQRLRERGLCDRGIVPKFLGMMRKFDPEDCQHLKKFFEDEYPPSAIFLEFIPNLETITFENYRTQQMENLITGFEEIHKALIQHGDPMPRNMGIIKDSPDRALWLDFDRAEVYDDEDSITDRQKFLIEEEKEIVAQFKDAMEADHAKGEFDIARKYYW